MNTDGIDIDLRPEEKAWLEMVGGISELINQLQTTRNSLDDMLDKVLEHKPISLNVRTKSYKN